MFNFSLKSYSTFDNVDILTIFWLITQTSVRTLNVPDLVDDYYLNLLDWGSANVSSRLTIHGPIIVKYCFQK